MKPMLRFSFLSCFLFLLFFQTQLKASHTLGGEIGWSCLSNGKYQFTMKFFRDCSGIPIPFFGTNQTIEIFGNPLPKDSNRNNLSSILLEPDSLTFFNNREGDTSPICDSTTGTPLSCPNASNPAANGLLQVFYYKSKPIALSGVPPSGGWHFRWESICCRPGNMENVNTPGTLILRAMMFPTKDSSDVSPCLDASPQFISSPSSIACRGVSSVNLSSMAIDPDMDSLVYRWATPVGPPIEVLVPLEWKTGFSEQNPLPDASFDPENIPAQLNSQTGALSFKVNSGGGTLKYYIANRVDAYREGVKIASIYREYPLSVFDCNIEIDSLHNNQAPQVRLNNKGQERISLNLIAGQKVSIPLQFSDRDSFPSSPNAFQEVRVWPISDAFGSDLSDSSSCTNPPCPYINSSQLTFDSLRNREMVKGRKEVNFDLIWNTDCNQLKGAVSKTYFFYFDSMDETCPIPARAGAVIQITLYDDNTSTLPEFTCIEEESGIVELQWEPNITSGIGFKQWNISAADSLNGNFLLIDSIQDFNQRSYTDPIGKNRNRHYLIEAVQENSCDSLTTVSKSDTISNFFAPLKWENQMSCLQLKWEEAEQLLANEINRKYHIYREFPIGSRLQLIDSVMNDTIYCDSIIACDQRIRYQVRLAEPTCLIAYQTDTLSLKINDFFVNNFIEERNQSLFALAPFGLYQWYDCRRKDTIFGETERTFSPKDTGSYALIITQFGCRDTSDCLLFFPVGLEENSLQNQVRHYPNPTDGRLSIELGEKQQALQLSIRNIHGQVVMEADFEPQNLLEVDIPGKSGLYFIQLTNKAGERANLKVVKN